MSELGDAALEHAARGWAVFPLRPLGKVPAIPSAHPAGERCRGECGADGHGLYDASTDPERVARWWDAMPDANIGARTGLLFDVCDIDGDDGFESFAALAGGDDALIGEGPVAYTPGKPGGGVGVHVYVESTGHGNRAGFRAGLDWRGRGGYVVVPPSVRDTGAYRWSNLEVHASLDVFSPAPAWLLDALNAGVQNRTPDRDEVTPANASARAGFAPMSAMDHLEHQAREVTRAPIGERNTALYVAARELSRRVQRGEIPADVVARVLSAAGRQAGLDDYEVTATINSAFTRRGMGKVA